jgi:hypothetical protein
MKVLLTIVVLFLSLAAISQVIVHGNVADSKTNQPVEGATVTLLPSNIYAITDANGNFIFKGKYENSTAVMVNTIGYELQTFAVADLKKKHRHFHFAKTNSTAGRNGDRQCRRSIQTHQPHRYCHAWC